MKFFPFCTFVDTGHYLPTVADAIYEANQAGKCNLNLQGVLMGGPWTAPASIEASYPDFAEYHGLISRVCIRSKNFHVFTYYSLKIARLQRLFPCRNLLLHTELIFFISLEQVELNLNLNSVLEDVLHFFRHGRTTSEGTFLDVGELCKLALHTM